MKKIGKNDRISVVYVDPKTLKPAEYNPRKTSDKQHAQLKESISRFGMKDPLIVNSSPKEDFTGNKAVKL